MALISCPECNKQISDKANICVGCGAPVVIDLPQSNSKSDASVAEERSTDDHTSLNTSNLGPKIDNSNLGVANSEVKRGTFKTFFGYLLVSFIIIFLLFFLLGGNSDTIFKNNSETTTTTKLPNSNYDYILIIGTPIKIGNLEVAQYDFPLSIKWDVAKVECVNLGPGWRLPTKKELNLLYKNKDIIGGFEFRSYWSSSVRDNGNVWLQDFQYGFQGDGYTGSSGYYARAVRTF